MIRALDTLSFGLCLLGWLLLGIFGTWQETAPFWIGAPLLWAAALCGLFTLHWGLRGKLSVPCLVSVSLFVIYILWRALSSDVAYLARQDIVFCGTAFIGWVLTAARYEKPKHRFALLIVWGLLVMANLGMGLYQTSGHPDANPLRFLGLRRDTQDAVFGGFFPNSNHLCGFLELVSFPLLAIAVLGRVHSFVRLLCGLVFAAACTALAFSTSRGGLVSFGCGVVLFLLICMGLRLMRRERGRGGKGLAAGILVVLVVLIGAAGWLARHQLEAKFGVGGVFRNLNGRAELWDRALEQFQEAPFLGTGARSYEYYERSLRTLESRWVSWSDVDIDAIFAHNDWVQVVTDYGIVGILLALVVLGTHVWNGASWVLRDVLAARKTGHWFTDYRGALMTGTLCGLFAFALHCTTDFQMHIGCNAVLAAAILGMLANPGAAPGTVQETVEIRQRKPRGFAVTGAALPAAVMAWCFLPWAIGDYHYYRAMGVFNRAQENPEDMMLAAARMQVATEADPQNYQAWNYFGHAETGTAGLFAATEVLEKQYLQKALDRYLVAHRLYPQHPDISANIARTYDRLLRFDEAEEWFQKALAWGNGSRLIHWFYADHLARTGRYQEAIDHYVPVIHKTDARSWRRKALQSKYELCLKLLAQQRAREKAPVPPPVLAPVPGEQPK